MNPKICVRNPESFNEVQECADMLLENNVLIVNFCKLNQVDQNRFFDYLAGVCNPNEIEFASIGDPVLIYVPKNIVLDRFTKDFGENSNNNA